jgi:hypothetical protein
MHPVPQYAFEERISICSCRTFQTGLPLCAALMVASNHRRLGGVSLLLLAASFAFLQQTQAFYDSPSRVSDLLGDHQVRVNQDGYVDFAETRVNIYGERSSVAYRYKPHFEKLKLRVDHSCFSVKSLDGKVVLQSKNDHFSSRSSSHDCLHSSVTSLTSTEDFTGRTFAFSSQQPSIHDVRSGDILLGVSDMHGMPASFKITSVIQRSVASHPSKAEFEFAVQPVQITDLVSEGEYEFYTDNILTVNDIARSKQKMTTKSDSQYGPKDLVSMVSQHVSLAHICLALYFFRHVLKFMLELHKLKW